MRKVQVEVNNVANNSAKTQIKNALNKIDGVGEVSVNKAESTITVNYNPPASEHLIKNAIEHAGHTIESEME